MYLCTLAILAASIAKRVNCGSLLVYVAALFLAVAICQVVSASMAAWYLGHFKAAQSLLIDLGMPGKAELAFVVVDIAYGQNDIPNAGFLNIS